MLGIFFLLINQTQAQTVWHLRSIHLSNSRCTHAHVHTRTHITCFHWNDHCKQKNNTVNYSIQELFVQPSGVTYFHQNTCCILYPLKSKQINILTNTCTTETNLINLCYHLIIVVNFSDCFLDLTTDGR